MNNNPTKISKTSAGFTLIEILVAIVVIGISFGAILATTNSVLSSTSLIRNNYIAVGLAQEGVEIVRNMRDNQWHDGTYSFEDADNSIVRNGSFSVQYDSTMRGNKTNLNTDFLNINANGPYSFNAGQPTPFARSVTISTPAGSLIEKIIQVTVQWKERGYDKSIVVEDHLFNWK